MLVLNQDRYEYLPSRYVGLKWAGFLKLQFPTDDLTVWRWIRRVKTVLFEAVRANV